VEKHIDSVRKLIHLVPSISANFSIPGVEKVCEEYEVALNSRLTELNANIITHANIPHSVIVSRALACRKPFRESDKGYRDTLLWEVILREVANPARTTFFLTANYDDFGDKKNNGQLHPHLVDDLVAAKYPSDCVQLYTNLKAFTDEQIAPHLRQVASEAIEELRKGKYHSFSINDWFLENRDKFINSANDWIEGLLPSLLENPEVSYIEDPDELTVEDVINIEDDKVYIDAVALSDVIVDVFIYKPDYFTLSEEHSLEIMDRDWNEHYMWAQRTVTLPISFSIIFNVLSEQVEDFEINPVEEIFGWCPACGAPILSDAAEICPKCGKSLISKVIAIRKK
jgi:hypothetical protein